MQVPWSRMNSKQAINMVNIPFQVLMIKRGFDTRLRALLLPITIGYKLLNRVAFSILSPSHNYFPSSSRFHSAYCRDDDLTERLRIIQLLDCEGQIGSRLEADPHCWEKDRQWSWWWLKALGNVCKHLGGNLIQFKEVRTLTNGSWVPVPNSSSYTFRLIKNNSILVLPFCLFQLQIIFLTIFFSILRAIASILRFWFQLILRWFLRQIIICSILICISFRCFFFSKITNISQ